MAALAFAAQALAALALAALLATACATGGSVLSEREREAGRNWKPTRWEEGKGSALVVMDMQVANMPIVAQAEVIGNIGRLVAAADAARCPVVWVYSDDEDSRPGEPGFEIVPPLAPSTAHLRVVKTGTSVFAGTGLDATLEALGVGRLVFCGVSSNECVRASVAASYYDGWLTVVARDAHSIPEAPGAAEAVASMNARWAEDRRVELLKSASITFAAPR